MPAPGEGDVQGTSQQTPQPVQLSSLSSLPSIERLNGRENWSSWKFAVETFLELEELWEVVKPTPNEDGTYPAVNAAKDRRARAKIILLLDPTNYVHVKEAKSAREVWAKLEAAFEDNGLTRRVGLLRKLITTNLSNCNSMEVYVTEIVSTAHQLQGIGFEISEEWVGTLLLAGLPEDYRPMIMAIENSGAKISGDSIKTKLLQELHSSHEKAAFVGKKSFQSRYRQAGRAEPKTVEHPKEGKGPKCKYCHKFGHIAKHCPAKKSSAFCTVLATNQVKDDEQWIFDSGASDHFTKDRGLLLDERAANGAVIAADQAVMNIVAEGVVKLEAECCPERAPIEVNNVKYIPGMSNNLLSISQIVRRGHEVQFHRGGVKVIDHIGDVIATGVHDESKGLFFFAERGKSMAKSLACYPSDLNTWHRRMGHLNWNGLKQLKNGLATGIQFPDSVGENCVICAMGKQHRFSFPKQGSRATEVLEVVHSDICGPMEVTSLGGSRYYLSFTDDKTRRIFIYFLPEKSEAELLNAFNQFHSMSERQTGHKLKVLCTDNGKEFINKAFEKRLKAL